MGRGGYETTDSSKKKSAMGDAALYFADRERKKNEEAAVAQAAEDAELKLIKSKKSRGIIAAKRAANETAVKPKAANSR